MVYLSQDKTVAVVQARMGSTRLPGKVLRPFHNGGLTMLELLLRRLKQCTTLDAIVVAFPFGIENDIINRTVAMAGVMSVRGDEHDVLDRFYRAAMSQRPGVVARVCADNPLTDPRVIDRCVEVFRQQNKDYLIPEGLPPGTFAEIFTFDALQRAWDEADSPEDREHVTTIMRRDKSFSVHKLRWESARWQYKSLTVDTEQDFNVIDSIIARSGGDGTGITLDHLKQ